MCLTGLQSSVIRTTSVVKCNSKDISIHCKGFNQSINENGHCFNLIIIA